MTFNEILELRGRTVVLFYGTGCAPCDALKKELRPFAATWQRQLVEINVASDLLAARQLGLRSVPAVVLVTDGVPKIISLPNEAPRYVLDRLRGLAI